MQNVSIFYVLHMRHRFKWFNGAEKALATFRTEQDEKKESNSHISMPYYYNTL